MEQDALVRWSRYESLLPQHEMMCDAIAFSPSTEEHLGVTVEQI